MNEKTSTKKPTHLERISDSCLAFRLDNQYISDNNYLFIAPTGNFCRACFQRRYLTQMMNEVKNTHLHHSVLSLALKLDDNYDNKTWQAYSVTDQKHVMTFDLISYDDCPACSKPESYSIKEVSASYKKLLEQETKPDLEALIKQVFSFGFARKIATTTKTGLPNSDFDKLMGNNYEARILFRMIAPDGRYADDSAIGFNPNEKLAELKSLMEYLERYAFMMQLCRYKTIKYEDQIIVDTIALYRKKLSYNEHKHIRNNACLGINLSTKKIHAIPFPFIFNQGLIPYVTPTSSGFGAHTNFKNSLCSSIIELIERDAFVRFWYDPQRAYNIEPNKELKSDIDSIISILKPVVNNEAIVSSYFVIQSPTKLPVVLITISSNDFSKSPSLCFGCGAGFDIDEAFSGALEELRQNITNLVKADATIDGYLTRQFTRKVVTIPDRMNFYSTSIPREKLHFLDNVNPLVDGIVEVAEDNDLEALVDRFKQIDFDIYGLDCTPGCFQDKNVYVTRAFSPQLYPLQFEQEGAFKISTSPMSAHKELPHFFL